MLASTLLPELLRPGEGTKMYAQLTETEPELCLSVSCGGTGQQLTTAVAGVLGSVDLGVE